jgi:hypothetical protein
MPRDASKPTRRLVFRFSLRTLLVGITLLCIGLAWWVHRVKRQVAAVKGIRDNGGWVYYDYEQWDGKKGKPAAYAESWVPKWLLARLGVDFFHSVEAVSMVYHYDGQQRFDNSRTDAVIGQHLADLPYLRALYVKERQLTDEDYRIVSQLSRLEVFFQWDAHDITDEGVIQLGNLSRLRNVHISESHLSNRGLAALAQLPQIEHLTLQSNDITDAGVRALEKNSTLETLWIGGLSHHPSQLTDAAVADLASIPNLRVLELQHTQVTVSGLQPLKDHPRLAELHLSGSKADSKAAQAVLPKVKVN